MSNHTVLTMTARKASSCPTCREAIEAGEKIARHEYGPRRWSHARCVVTALRSGRTIQGGAAELVYLNALGERVGDNRASVVSLSRAEVEVMRAA